mgnify:CR=1 FL=1|jgi:hypothetical protein
MNSIRALIAAVALLPLAAACGPSCEEVCDKRIQCQSTASLGIASETRDGCISSCEAGFCGNEEKTALANECYAQMMCSSAVSSASELVTCASRCD